MVRVLFLFLTRFHVNVACSNGNPTAIKVTASCCDLPQRQYFEDLFNENEVVFSYDKNPHLPQNCKAVDHVFRFAFVGVLIILERRNK